MTYSQRLLTSLLVPLLIGGQATSFAQAPGEKAPPEEDVRSLDPEQLLQRLKQRDADFDNLSIQTDQCWTERVSPRAQVAARQFDALRSGQTNVASPQQDEIPEDFDQPHRVRYLLTARGPELTLERQGDLEPAKHQEFVALQNKGFRWSTVGGIEKSYSPETKILHVLGKPRSAGVLRSYQWKIEWCCGYGIAKRMTAIDAVSRKGQRIVVQGKLVLIDDDDSRVVMELDRDWIVRHAVISLPSKSGNGSNDYVVKTKGTVRPENGPPVAETGHFQRILKPSDKPARIYEEFDFRFVSITGPLTDLEYSERTRFDLSPDARIVDMQPKH